MLRVVVVVAMWQYIPFLTLFPLFWPSFFVVKKMKAVSLAI